MTEKKSRKQKPDENPEAESAVENGEQAQVQAGLAEMVADLEKRLAEAQSKSAEYLDGWQRSRAEFANYKSRIERDQSSTSEMMRAQYIKNFLPVIDDLELALNNRPAEAGAWVNGVELIYRKMLSLLDTEGVKRIEAEGQPFDPNLHEAISMEPCETCESGHVIGVVRQGYKIGERVIRPAMVRVAQ